MSGETADKESGWTVDTWAQHTRKVDELRDRLEVERDRRYAEVNIEKEKALKIKETADLAALQLAREIQTYKDEKANQLREQISSERGDYLTRTEYLVQHQALIDKVEDGLKPLNEFMSGQVGSSGQRTESRLNSGQLIAALSLVVAFIVGTVAAIALVIHG